MILKEKSLTLHIPLVKGNKESFTRLRRTPWLRQVVVRVDQNQERTMRVKLTMACHDKPLHYITLTLNCMPHFNDPDDET